MRKSKRYPTVDDLPLQLPDSMSGYEKESREAEAKLADARKAKKKNPRNAKTSTDPRKHMDKFVVSVGTLPELLSLREAVLQSAGFEVLTIAREKEALKKIETTDCGVLLLCYSIDERTRQHLAKKYRELCPEGRIVTITNAPLPHPPVEADSFVYGVEGAQALIAAVS
jgi:PleD family two-component response regulator